MDVITRGAWATRIGFILAATGSAIGLGNIWKFPYITGVYGGGAFVLVYLGAIALVGLPLMFAEITLGKAGQSDPVGSMTKLAPDTESKVFGFLIGVFGVVSGFLILSFYSVIAGWAIHFLMISIQGYPGGAEEVGTALGTLASANEGSITSWSMLWHTVFMVITVGIVAVGIKGGIELACKVLMPTLALILVGLMVMGLTMEGGSVAVDFMFGADFSSLTGDAWLEALGHSFFTLSLGMGAMITYGSYLKKSDTVVKSALAISVADTAIALVAGIAIFSVTFTYCLEPAAGPGLVFATLPVQFSQMSGGVAVGIAFFALLVFAALTSAISLLEVVVAFVHDRFKVPRPIAAVVMGVAIYLLGVASVFDMDFLDLLDNLTTKYTLPLGGLFISVYAGWLLSRRHQTSGFGEDGAVGPLFTVWLWALRTITPILVVAVIVYKLELDIETGAAIGVGVGAVVLAVGLRALNKSLRADDRQPWVRAGLFLVQLSAALVAVAMVVQLGLARRSSAEVATVYPQTEACAAEQEDAESDQDDGAGQDNGDDGATEGDD